MDIMFLFQALDGAFNQENREKCRAATGPLIEAVDNLTAFASNPEFASIPAQISPEVSHYLTAEAFFTHVHAQLKNHINRNMCCFFPTYIVTEVFLFVVVNIGICSVERLCPRSLKRRCKLVVLILHFST